MTGKLRSAATAVADVQDSVILARVEIAVPPERVFAALTTEELTKWWGSAEDYRTTKFSMELRLGGKWRSDGLGADGSTFHVEGEVLEVDPPRRLVQTWRPSWDPGPATTIVYTLDPLEGGTRVTIRHFGFANAATCESHSLGWQRVLGWLGGHLAKDERRTYLCKLYAPRPTFMTDMTPDEREIMNAHVAYWRAKLAEGHVVAFGPVGDPSGVWGLGIVKAKDDAELAAFRDGDPTIASGRGFRYDVIPMVTVVY